MATQLQIRRGTAAQVAAFTGAEGEIVYNSTNDSLHTNDGATAGGFELARIDGSNFSISNNVAFTTLSTSGLLSANAGINVTGTVTMDGLTVDGSASLSNTSVNQLNISGLTKITGVRGTFVDPSEDPSIPNIFATNDAVGDFSQEAGHLVIQPRVHPTVYRDVIFAGGAGTTKRLMTIQGEGDISFYEDTGTTPKFFWDASAESLDIGLQSTAITGLRGARRLVLNGDGTEGVDFLAYASTNGIVADQYIGGYLLGNDDNNGDEDHFAGMWANAEGTGGSMTLRFAAGRDNYENDTPQMMINGLGNVGIGSSSPRTLINASSATGAILTLESSDTTLTTNGVIGGIDFYSNDSSTNGTGAKVNIRAIAQNSSGTATALTFGTSSSGSATAVEAFRVDASGNVGLGGITSPQAGFGVSGCVDTNGAYFARGQISAHQTNAAVLQYGSGLAELRAYGATAGSGQMRFSVGGGGGSADSEAMRIDNSGNLLVGKTAANFTVAGHELKPASFAGFTRNGGSPVIVNRLTNDGDLIEFYRGATTVGSIGTAARGSQTGLFLNSEATGTLQLDGVDEYSWDGNQFYPSTDNSNDLGFPTFRWDDIYATNGTIQTSDRNEKQDIEELSAAETAVAVACKGLLRKFRWIDSVEEKGDDARIHFGIIAQDLQAAFEAEGLDAGRYAMFMSNTWWETQTEVEAVEAVEEVTDEEGNVTTEGVEAKDAYTRTDTFQTLADAPEGATERTRLGVRYPELLAFIIAAI